MGKIRILLGVAATFIVLALLSAWVVPPLLDWNRYRDNIAVLASAVLGRPVSIAGRVSLTLLPQAVLTATDVTVSGSESGPNGGGNSALTGTARELRLRVALLPLLSGTVAARELVLRHPVIHLAWPLAPGALSFRRPPWLASVSARIEGGTLSVGDISCGSIDATLAAGGDNAGAATAGTAQCDGRGWRFTARATGVGGDGAEGLDVAIDGQGPSLGLGAAFSGQLAADRTLSGQITARGPDLSQLLPAPAVPFRGSGRLTLAAGLAAADDLTLEIGGSPAHGAVTLAVTGSPRLDVALAASRLDLDAWLPVLLRQTGFAWPVGLDLSAEAIQFDGGLLRRVRADFELTPDGQTTVREVSAVLPGDASLRLAGQVGRSGSQRRFNGNFSLAAPDLRSTLRWLEGSGLKPLSVLPPDVLRTADLVASVSVEGSQVALTGLRGQVDGARLSGELGLGFGPRLAIAAHLNVVPLQLDPWLAGPTPALADIADRLAAFDADLQVSSPHVLWHGLTARDLAFDAAASDGRLAVRRLALRTQGVTAQLSGSIGDGGRITDGHLSMAGEDVAPLADLLPASWRIAPLWRGPCRLDVQASGTPQALGLRIGLDLADARLEAQPVIDLDRGSWAGPFTLRHPGATRLLQRLGLTRAQWIGDGSLSLVAQVTGTPGRIAADKFELGAGALRAGGDLTLEQGTPLRLSGRIAAETLPVPQIDLRATEPLPLDLLRGWRVALALAAGHVVTQAGPLLDDVSANLAIANGVLRFDDVKAALATTRVAGGRLTGSAMLDTTAEPPRAGLHAALTGGAVVEPLTGLPLDLAAGRLDGSAELTAEGHSPAALLSTLDGRIGLSATNGALSGFDLSQLDDLLAKDPSDAALRQSLSGGSTGFDRFDVTAAAQHGNLALGTATMTGPAGTAAFIGGVDAAGASLDLHATLRPATPDAPELGLRISGPWTSARRIPELADITRWRSTQAAK